jgi:hypothetical protein
VTYQKNIGKAVPLYEYLIPEKEESIERHTKFLEMVKNLEADKIEEISEEQKILNKQVPFKIKYPKDYLWQIYYSEYTNKYFMLVTIEDLEYSAFFYLLKQQLAGNKGKIFVPISYTDYSREYLTRTQETDIENYLWYFTKEWPLVYEVYDKENNLTVHITGKTNIFDEIKSDYKIKLKSKQEAEKFYKLLKALFIMQTEAPHYYNFEISIDEKGSLQFSLEGKKIIYEILSSFIKQEYLKAEEKDVKIKKELAKLEKSLSKIKEDSKQKEQIYLEKEKQISTFLECKKTFFGRVKYFFKNKKLTKPKQEEKKKEETKPNTLIEQEKYDEIKKYYTLEELIALYKKVNENEIRVKNLRLDEKALTNRLNNLNKKIENAELYIKEIDEHKKSIFEFWKFTNKDKKAELVGGEIKEENTKKLKKVFNYELDFEDLSKQLDKKQRLELTQAETNSIYIATTDIINDINTVANGEKITEERLEKVKEEASKEKILFENEPFDIFGAIESNNNYVKTLANKKHREIKKELFRILDISQNTTVEEYTETINNIIKDIKNAIKKIKIEIQIPVYKEAKDLDKFNIFSINPEDAIARFKNSEEEETNLYKINLKENDKVVALTNIIYYFNNNKTLPLGMDVEEGLLLEKDKAEEKIKEAKTINLVCYKNPDDEMSKIEIKKIHVKNI